MTALGTSLDTSRDTTLDTTLDTQRRGALGHLFAAAAFAAGLTAARPARAEAFPSKPIMLVLPFPPGGSFDPILRALCDAAGKDLGQPIVLMHKPGGGGVTGTATLASMSESDGYTLALMHNSVIRQPLLMKTAWNPLTATLLKTEPFAFCIRRSQSSSHFTSSRTSGMPFPDSGMLKSSPQMNGFCS